MQGILTTLLLFYLILSMSMFSVLCDSFVVLEIRKPNNVLEWILGTILSMEAASFR